MPAELKHLIEKAWDDRSLLKEEKVRKAIHDVIALLDQGRIRVGSQVTIPGP